MKIFMTGATGYIGSVITEKLLQAGHQVVGLARSDASARALQGLGARPLRGSLGDTQLLTDAARAADGVIQNAFDLGADFATATAEEAKAVDTLITALRGSGKPLVYTSGTGGLGDTGSVVYDEETPIAASESPTVRALQLRFETEKAVTSATGLRGVALRPPNVFGRGGGRSVLWLIGAAGHKLGAVPYPKEAGDNLWSLVHVDDLADLYVLAVEKAPGGELFHAASRSGLRTRTSPPRSVVAQDSEAGPSHWTRTNSPKLSAHRRLRTTGPSTARSQGRRRVVCSAGNRGTSTSSANWAGPRAELTERRAPGVLTGE